MEDLIESMSPEEAARAEELATSALLRVATEKLALAITIADMAFGRHDLAFVYLEEMLRFARAQRRALPRKLPIPPRLRKLIFTRDGHRCLHCGTTEDLTVDHVFPESKGGSMTVWNLQTLCRPCNSRKGVR